MKENPEPSAKEVLRRTMRRALAALAPDRERLSAEVVRHLEEASGDAEWIAFMPRGDEPNILPCLEARWKRGLPVILPRVDGTEIALHRVVHEDQLVTGAFGLREPRGNTPRWMPEGAAVCWVPGLAFDARGSRLGRGKGYYDRLLARLGPAIQTVGVFFAAQEIPRVPCQAHDIPLHAVVTEAGWRKIPNL
jgi:5-formyltetrahydrofolate cyclo-ligase